MKDKKKFKKAILRTYSMDQIKELVKKAEDRLEEIDNELNPRFSGNWKSCFINPPPPQTQEYWDISRKMTVLKELIETYDK